MLSSVCEHLIDFSSDSDEIENKYNSFSLGMENFADLILNCFSAFNFYFLFFIWETKIGNSLWFYIFILNYVFMVFLLGVSIYQHILLNLSVCEECFRTFAMGLWHAWSSLFDVVWNYLELFGVVSDEASGR